jgi:hypothetical protein
MATGKPEAISKGSATGAIGATSRETSNAVRDRTSARVRTRPRPDERQRQGEPRQGEPRQGEQRPGEQRPAERPQQEPRMQPIGGPSAQARPDAGGEHDAERRRGRRNRRDRGDRGERHSATAGGATAREGKGADGCAGQLREDPTRAGCASNCARINC